MSLLRSSVHFRFWVSVSSWVVWHAQNKNLVALVRVMFFKNKRWEMIRWQFCWLIPCILLAAAQTSSSLLSLTVLALLVPAAFATVAGDGEEATEGILALSHGTSIVLLIVYILYLVFQVKQKKLGKRGRILSDLNDTIT